MTLSAVSLPFLLTFLAGLITVIGGLLAVGNKKPSDRFLSIVMGFSAGMILYVGFVEILPESSEYLHHALSEDWAHWGMFLSFFGGMILLALTERLIPHHHDHDHLHEAAAEDHCPKEHIYLYKTGMATMLAIGLHNFPEGFAMFSAMLQDLSLGLPLVIAVCLHNIPIGLAIAAPIYAAGKNKKRAVLLSLTAGMFTPLGALIGYLILHQGANDLIFGIIMGAVAGIMVFVAINELYPAARRYGKGHSATYALIAGMVFIAAVMQLTGHVGH